MHAEPQLPAPQERSPLEYFHGLYIADATGFGGAAAFSWFRDDAEALAHLRHRLVPLYLSSSEEAEECGATALALESALRGVQSLKAVNLGAVNAALKRVCELRWAGSLDDLRVGNTPFEQEIQHDYHENLFGDERGQTDSEWDDFAHHLTHYTG